MMSFAVNQYLLFSHHGFLGLNFCCSSWFINVSEWVTCFSAPATVSNVSVAARTSNSFNISFVTVPGADEYRVAYTNNSEQINTTFTSNNITITGLVDGTRYTINITAANSFAVGDTISFNAGFTRAYL